jgi:molybdopterin converting factor small subunit
MPVTLLIPSALRSFTDRQSTVRVEASTVEEALAALTDAYPDIRRHLYGDDNALRPFVNLYLGETNIKNTGGTATPLKDGDEVALVPSIAGGGRARVLPPELCRIAPASFAAGDRGMRGFAPELCRIAPEPPFAGSRRMRGFASQPSRVTPSQSVAGAREGRL